jgi:glycosyltransferase involved in cell wall biosynthesis
VKKIVLFTHPHFEGHQSMPRFAAMLADGMRKRGFSVEVWMPLPRFHSLPAPKGLKKWLGYLDQYLLFPAEFRRRIKTENADTLFVFTDQALGPWVPLVAHRPHIIHCHDFLALRSALGEMKENNTSWTGRLYQGMIRSGFGKGKYFISVSHKTRDDLHRFLPSAPLLSEVVYNGLNRAFEPAQDQRRVRKALSAETGLELTNGYLVHVGGNQWYKNRAGVIELYTAWRHIALVGLPLLYIGEPPSASLLETYHSSPFTRDIYFLSNKTDLFVEKAYQGATLLLFPSLAEGFGWPIAEAMATGCPVLTTNEAPMTEVGGDAAIYVERYEAERAKEWCSTGAKMIEEFLTAPPAIRENIRNKSLINANRFNSEKALDHIKKIYDSVIKEAGH